MLNGELCKDESAPHNVHELSIPNGELCDVELHFKNINEHTLENNLQIHIGKSDGNRSLQSGIEQNINPPVCDHMWLEQSVAI